MKIRNEILSMLNYRCQLSHVFIVDIYVFICMYTYYIHLYVNYVY